MDITDEQRAKFQSAFNLFDENKDGTIDVEQIGVIFRALGQTPTEGDIARIIREVQEESNGLIDFETFFAYLQQQMAKAYTEKDIKKAFEVLDFNGDGTIPAADLFHVMTTVGEPLSEDQVEEMFKEAEIDKENGVITFEDFQRMLAIR
eukprot:TRINITY_DN7412_c0_g1_i1.p2 TRINITY_DN7412_c0_g1~~TRINITY_DN7412_c0_g1_i1.p2  ORF type:complete len:149 (-),score=38.92 TRINITY_DN7412_c0_g1_i1:51-497(-)